MLTQERLKELVSYDPETGIFTRVLSTGGQVAGSILTSTNKTRSVRIDRGTYTLNQLAWLYVHGKFPDKRLKLLDGNPDNQRISNIVETGFNNEITQDYLKKILYYNHETGVFTRVGCLAPVDKLGEVVGHKNNQGYIIVKIHRIAYKSHRLAFLFMNGSFPDDGIEVDHINHDRSDNRWVNLRTVTKSINSRNKKLSVRNQYPVPGITKRESGKYRVTIGATIMGNKRNLNIGTFDTLNEAIAARREMEVKLGYHENHG